jgi:anthraniloyl-CoA monooxygenase
MGAGMKIVCLGGGPASLYFSILMKKANPEHEITVIERGQRDSTWGFGVVFSDDTLKGFMEADAPSYKRIVEEFAYWGGIDVSINGRTIHSDGHGFCGMSRLKLLNIFHDSCEELGVRLKFNTEITDLKQLEIENHDLVVAGDGLSSILREGYKQHFGTSVDVRTNKFCWLATTLPLNNFNFIFKKNQHGWWWAHAYRYQEGATTWIAECSEETWLRAGLDRATEAAGKAYLEDVFAEELQGHVLITNRSVWRNFPVIRNENLYYKNIVLMGDAVRSAHFSIGSGTKLAMEDAITLANCLREHDGEVRQALEAYQVMRKPEADRLQRTAVTSLSWFEHIDRYTREQDIEQFTFNLLVRSKRVTYENLRLRDPEYIKSVDLWFAQHVKKVTGFADIDTHKPVAPMFQPFKIGKMRVENRIELSAMCQYGAVDGTPNEWHFVHYGARALGGVGLLNTEMLCISPEARITPGCAGIWNDEQTREWRHTVDFIHANTRAKVCAQLGHAGGKGATCIPFKGGVDQPLPAAAWQIVAASPIPYLENSQVPHEIDVAGMNKIVADFVNATKNAERAGFDMVEIHMAHGYLLSGFISPVTNFRADEFGGSLEQRMKFPLRVVDSIREVWPPEKPVSVRISATDWVEGGLPEAELLLLAKLLKQHGVDVINVSTGQVTKAEEPIYGRMFQAPFADQVRNETGIATIVAGNITSPDQCNTLVAAGRTDIVALGRAIMNEPHFVLNAAAHYGYQQQFWPDPYLSGKFSAEILAEKRNQEDLELRVAAKPPNPVEALAIAVARGEVLQD